MDDKAFFWQVMNGQLPPPAAAATLGAEFVSIDAEAGRVTMRFQGRADFTNPAGHIQGGFLAAMLDDTMGPALAATLRAGEIAPTLNLQIAYHRPGRIGALDASGWIVRRSREVAFLAGELRQGGELVATASATALVRGPRA